MTLHIRKMKLLYTPNFMFVDASVIEFREFNRKRRRRRILIIWDHFQATVKLTLQVLHVFYKIILICLLISLAFNMLFTLMLVELKLSGIWK